MPIDEYVRCYSMPGGIRAMLSIERAMLIDAAQNRRAARRRLDIPVLALGGSAFIGERNESRMRSMAHDDTVPTGPYSAGRWASAPAPPSPVPTSACCSPGGDPGAAAGPVDCSRSPAGWR